MCNSNQCFMAVVTALALLLRVSWRSFRRIFPDFILPVLIKTQRGTKCYLSTQ